MIEHIQEEDLQQRLREDDKSALEYIYKSYKSEFINFSQRYKLNIEDALDIYQDAIIAMYQNFVMQHLELNTSSIKTYLFGIGKYKIFNVLKERSKYLQVVKEQNDYDEIKLEENEFNLYQKQLSNLLSNISESCRDLLKLYYYRNLTINEIVEQTNYKDANTVKSHKSRCMKRLKSLVNLNK